MSDCLAVLGWPSLLTKVEHLQKKVKEHLTVRDLIERGRKSKVSLQIMQLDLNSAWLTILKLLHSFWQ